MLLLLNVLSVAYAPGEVVNVTSFNTSGCADPTSITADGLCFSVRGEYLPSSFCRSTTEDCADTNQSVVSNLQIFHTGGCTTYQWTWSCAHEPRIACGVYWCDRVSTCVDDFDCVCPDGMEGDPVAARCFCPRGFYENGTSCEPIQNITVTPVNWTTGMPRVEQTTVTVEEELSPWVVALVVAAVIVACGVGVIIGQWYGQDNVVVPAVEPVRHAQNAMYVPGGPMPRSAAELENGI